MQARPTSAVAALAFSLAFLCLVLAGLMAVPPAPYETRHERMRPDVRDRPLLTRGQKLEGQETGWVSFTDAGGMHYVIEWDAFRALYPGYLFTE